MEALRKELGIEPDEIVVGAVSRLHRQKGVGFLVEAASLARPIIASDIDGVREVLKDGTTGLLVPAGDAAARGGGIRRVLEDRALGRKLGERARARIPRAFSRPRMIAETQALYLELFKKKALPASP